MLQNPGTMLANCISWLIMPLKRVAKCSINDFDCRAFIEVGRG